MEETRESARGTAEEELLGLWGAGAGEAIQVTIDNFILYIDYREYGYTNLPTVLVQQRNETN